MSAGDDKLCPSSSPTTREGFDKLSDELLVKILSYVPHDDYINIMLVNHRFKRLSTDSSLWKKVDLVFPRTMQQMRQLANTIFPSISSNGVVEELKITGFLRDPVFHRGGRPWIDCFPGQNSFLNPHTPKTLSAMVMAEITASCPGLKTLVIRNCKMRSVHGSIPLTVPDTLQKLEFHNSRVPDTITDSLFAQWMDQGQRHLPNLVTLKFERCCNTDNSLESFLRICPEVKNLSLKGSLLQQQPTEYRQTFPTTFWNKLKVLDMSGTGYFPRDVYEEVLKNVPDCAITHLYMERCLRIPHITYDNLRIEFVSVAGLRDHDHPTVSAFDSIRNWAALPCLKEMNASGCQMSQAQREQLVTDYQNVTFNISVEFQESPRVEF